MRQFTKFQQDEDAVQQQRHHAGVAPGIQRSNQTQGAQLLLEILQKNDKMRVHGMRLTLDNTRKAADMKIPVDKLQQDQQGAGSSSRWSKAKKPSTHRSNRL